MMTNQVICLGRENKKLKDEIEWLRGIIAKDNTLLTVLEKDHRLGDNIVAGCMGNIISYEHHGGVVFVDEGLKGKHREHCLCFRCGNFFPCQPENCEIAEANFAICKKYNLTTPVFECPKFKTK